MAEKAIREYDGKKMIVRLIAGFSEGEYTMRTKYVQVTPKTKVNKLPKKFPWLKEKKHENIRELLFSSLSLLFLHSFTLPFPAHLTFLFPTSWASFHVITLCFSKLYKNVCPDRDFQSQSFRPAILNPGPSLSSFQSRKGWMIGRTTPSGHVLCKLSSPFKKVLMGPRGLSDISRLLNPGPPAFLESLSPLNGTKPYKTGAPPD